MAGQSQGAISVLTVWYHSRRVTVEGVMKPSWWFPSLLSKRGCRPHLHALSRSWLPPLGLDDSISSSEIKNLFRKESQKRWQKRWDCGKDARYTHSLVPKVKDGGYKNFCEKSTETKLNRLQLGTTLLKDHMHEIMPVYYESPNCDCGYDRATIEHYFLNCPLHATQRNKLINDIEYVLLKNTKRQFWDFSLHALIGKPDDLTYEIIPQIRRAVASFIRETAISI